MLPRSTPRRIQEDSLLQRLGVGTTPQGAKGPDVTFELPDSKQIMWMDCTTKKAWPRHYNSYGAVEGVGENLHQVLYSDTGYASIRDLKGKVF